MPGKIEEAGSIVGSENVIEETGLVESYSKDESFTPPVRVRQVIRPRTAEEVEAVVKWANQTGTPLVPVSSGPPHFRGDTVPAVGGAVIVDLSRMNSIIRINRRNRMIIIEPGVTYSMLIPALAKEGLRLSMPLLPRPDKSVLTSYLEREPILIPRYHWEMTEPLRSLQVIWGNGEPFLSGDAGEHGTLDEQWQRGLAQASGMGPFQVDYFRLLSAAQGTMGIVTWAAVKYELLPQIHKLFFVTAPKLDSLISFVYQVLRYRYGDELFFLNNTNLAAIVGKSPDRAVAIRDGLPPWVVLLGIAGRERLPEERVGFQEEEIAHMAQESGLRLQPALPGVSEGEVLGLLQSPSREPCWKLGYKGGCQDIFFLTTLDKTPLFTKTMYQVADLLSYPVSDIGIYIQPVVQGVGCHLEFNLPFNPENDREVERVKSLYISASEALLQQGAFFSRPYGIWSSMAYNRDAETTSVLRKLKTIFDPNNILNPSKLCF